MPLIANCAKAANLVKVMTNLDITDTSSELFLDVNADKIIAMIQAQMDFPLFVYSSDCTHCATIMPLVENYIKANKSTIYKFDALNSVEFNKLITAYPNKFYIGMTTPTFYMFSNDRCDSIPQENMNTEQSLKRVLDQYLQKSKTYTCIDVDGYTTYNAFEGDKLYFIINGETAAYNGFFSIIIKEKAFKSSKTTLFIDYNIISSNLDSTLTTEYTTYKDLLIIKTASKTTKIDFNASPNEAYEAVNSYYAN